MVMKLIVYTDWWARWNPGSAGLGVFITDEHKKEIEKRYKSLWTTTNNFAEAQWALYWIRRAIELGATEIELRMDSKLIINQLRGDYKIKNVDLKTIYAEINNILMNWNGRVTYIHIPRAKNIEADRLSNVAMNNNLIN